MSLKNIFSVLFLLLISTVVYSQETFRDNFTFRNYGNNNGSSNFSGNWIEGNDDNSPSNGRIDINTPFLGNGRLRFEDLSSNFHNIRRSADLNGANSVTLAFDFQTQGLDNREELAIQVSSNGTNFFTIGTFGGSNSGSFFQDITAFASSNTTFRFLSNNRSWEANEFAYIDNFLVTANFPTMVTIEDVTVNEDAGTATFTATVGGVNALGPFTVNYQTVNISATAGSDYTATSGTLTFTGTVGNTATFDVPILDDGLLEGAETFRVQMSNPSNTSVVVSDTAIGTIEDDEGVIMTNGSTSTQCSGVFLDPGGLGNYGNNLNVTHTLCPEPGFDYVAVDFTSFDMEAGDDFLFVYDGNSTGATLIGVYDNDNIPSYISGSAAGGGCLTFRFTSDNNGSGTGFQADIGCYVEGPEIIITDISFDEDVGNAIFTVESTRAPHGINTIFGFFETDFTVDYTTVDGSALAGSDYTAVTGTLTFSGEVGDIRTISVPIANDGVPEFDEDFTIMFTGANAPNNGDVNFSDTGRGTINSQILANVPLSLFRQFDGKYDYVTTGGTMRTQSNNGNACAIQATSTNQLVSDIPVNGTIAAAYLYWAHSSYVRDEQVTFEGQTVNAGFVYQTTFNANGTNLNFYGYVSDVTALVSGINNINTNNFDFSGLTIDTSNNFCNTQTVLGGWSLMVYYEDPSLPAVNINIYQGFDGLQNNSPGTPFTLDSFYAIAGAGAKATFLSWEGDDTLGSSGANPERLTITNQANTTFTLTGDGGQTGNNSYNGTIYDNTVTPTNYNQTNVYGVDLDTYDISTFIAPGDSQVTATVNVGQDYVINMAVVMKVPSNLITGTVFEDINYPGGEGRNQVNAAGLGVSGAIVELFESNGTFRERKNTDINGDYSFAGMEDGDYLIKVVNSTVRSNRTGGLNCTECFPVQTYRSFGDATTINEVTTEIGGANPSATLDAALGVLNNAQSVSSVTVASNGVTDIDFGFNFNTIVNTNEDGQGSLEQFVVNSNNLDQNNLDIEANSIFDPAAGEDVSIFMIPPTGDSFGRTADANFANGYFDILFSNGSPLSIITDNNTAIDGRTQTAYSGNTNTGTLGSGGSSVGVSNMILPNYERPEIQIHRNNGDVFITEGTDVSIRNLSIFANNNSGIRVDAGSLTATANIIGMDATGVTANDLNVGIENTAGNLIADGNYIANTGNYAIEIDGGTSNIIRNNHLANNGNAACDDAILITAGSGIQILQNLIESSASTSIDGEAGSGNIIISENSLTTSGEDGGNCSGSPQQMAIKLAGNNSEITSNKIYTNGGAGISIVGGASNLISQNSMYANGTATPALGIDLNDDGVTLNDNADGDSGPNGLENFPVISGAYLAGTNLVVTGWASPGTIVEVFFTDVNEGTAASGDNQLGLTQDYGEGQIYIGTGVEGSINDQDSATSAYTDADGNTDNTNKYKFVFPLPPGTVLGELVTATGTRSNSTSEFSPIVEISAYTVITNSRITYRVKTN
ncbi:CUB domain-containing protein [Maribacter sedimenticola]|uniref:CUB domain-containing protein n=1 Tax=Maribacter sedimenticola TaxID=228956 RepID=A0ABY1SMF7_9FLAO|nr:Calx-beta domain-containing protein [Maribacter sedimenticola]SNR82231.1 CUB domain-containing protein [Maribacter sedimenticola]